MLTFRVSLIFSREMRLADEANEVLCKPSSSGCEIRLLEMPCPITQCKRFQNIQLLADLPYQNRFPSLVKLIDEYSAISRLPSRSGRRIGKVIVQTICEFVPVTR